jgi:alpha-tubulin suppressor-like RCC1 family protein
VAAVGGGSRHACAIMDAGTVRCWGANDDGQIGDGTTTSRPIPVEVPTIADVFLVALGDKHSCALGRNGTVRCWGGNDRGQLGDGTNTGRTSPVLVRGLSEVLEIASGTSHVCARLQDSSVRCWGNNESGQLGDGTVLDRNVPVRVPHLEGVAQLALGAQHSCARLFDGTVRCWGSTYLGQLGSGKRNIEAPGATPAPVPGLAGIAELRAGQNHTCARTRDGAVYCWGLGQSCQLGDGTKVDRPNPTRVLHLTAVAELALGAQHTCVRLEFGDVACWGTDPKSYRPDNSTDPSVPEQCTPTRVALHGSTQIAATSSSTCALLSSGPVVCWGRNPYGVLGDGTALSRVEPLPVQWSKVTP